MFRKDLLEQLFNTCGVHKLYETTSGKTEIAYLTSFPLASLSASACTFTPSTPQYCPLKSSCLLLLSSSSSLLLPFLLSLTDSQRTLPTYKLH